MMTRAAILSTIGTALGTTQGSCLPFAAKTPSVPSYVAVLCGKLMVAGLLKATLKKIFSPFDIPPCTPPLLFVKVPYPPSSRFTYGSLCFDAGTSALANPLPISKPLVAGMESIACASLASSLSNVGSPSPGGQLRMTQVTVPPMESSEDFALRIRAVIFWAVEASGQRVGSESICARVMVCRRERYAGVIGDSSESSSFEVSFVVEDVGIWILPTEETNATISMLWASLRYFSAI